MYLRFAPLALSALALSACTTMAPTSHSGQGQGPSLAPLTEAQFSDDLSRRTFDYFWETTDTERCLAPDRWPSNPFSSIAATGFALTAFGNGAERGYVTREQAAERTRDCLEFYWNAPQGPAPTGMTGHKGFFYHFLDMETGLRYRDTELSTVDTTLLLAIGSATHPVPASVWDEWCSVYDRSWTDRWGPAHLHFAPMFGHQYSHMFVDFRGIRDAWMRAKSAELGHFDYFENSVRAVAAQRKYAADNPMGWAGYSDAVWGLTACDGPGDFKQVIGGREREFFSYSARGPGERDDGTIAPTAAMASMPFAAADVTACLKAMKARYGAGIYTEFGFLDSFNPTLTETGRTLQHGRIVPGVGWVDGDYLGIDQGPIVIMIENARSDIVWRRMQGEPNITRGLKRAGFTGGWLASFSDSGA